METGLASGAEPEGPPFQHVDPEVLQLCLMTPKARLCYIVADSIR